MAREEQAATITILFTGADGYAQFAEKTVPLHSVNETLNLSAVVPASGLQLRMSTPGASKGFHCTDRADCQLVIIQSGIMEIGLRDGSSRKFSAGESFLSMDFVPAGEQFDPEQHGHSSREVGGTAPLRTLFVKIPHTMAEGILAEL